MPKRARYFRIYTNVPGCKDLPSLTFCCTSRKAAEATVSFLSGTYGSKDGKPHYEVHVEGWVPSSWMVSKSGGTTINLIGLLDIAKKIDDAIEQNDKFTLTYNGTGSYLDGCYFEITRVTNKK